MLCQAIKGSDGKPCTNESRDGSLYCELHMDGSTDVVEEMETVEGEEMQSVRSTGSPVFRLPQSAIIDPSEIEEHEIMTEVEVESDDNEVDEAVAIARSMAGISIEEEPRPPIDWASIEGQSRDVYIVSELLQSVLDAAQDDITDLKPGQLDMWKSHFKYVVSDRGRLTVSQLLGSHDKWLRTIAQNTDERKIAKFQEKAAGIEDARDLMDLAVEFFEPVELVSVDINEGA